MYFLNSAPSLHCWDSRPASLDPASVNYRYKLPRSQWLFLYSWCWGWNPWPCAWYTSALNEPCHSSLFSLFSRYGKNRCAISYLYISKLQAHTSFAKFTCSDSAWKFIPLKLTFQYTFLFWTAIFVSICGLLLFFIWGHRLALWTRCLSSVNVAWVPRGSVRWPLCFCIWYTDFGILEVGAL